MIIELKQIDQKQQWKKQERQSVNDKEKREMLKHSN